MIPSIVILTETWLNANILNHEIFPSELDYEVYRRDRADGWGGVAIGVGPGLDSKLLHSAPDCEAIFIEIDLYLKNSQRSNPKSLIVGAAYRPPGSTPDYMNCLSKTILDVANTNKKSILWVGGDFNLPDINWKNYSVAGHQYLQSISETMIATMTGAGLDQIVNFPTRLDNTLDLFFTNRPSCVNKCQPVPGISDHEIVHINTDIMPRRKRPVKRKIYLWGKADMNVILGEGNKLRDKFLKQFNSSSSVIEMWEFIQAELGKILELVPSKWSSTRFHQPWVTRRVKQVSKQKQRAYNKILRSHRKNKKRLWERYNHLKKKMQSVCRNAYNEYINNIICPDLKSNPKRFWSHISSKRCDNNGVAPLRDSGGAVHTDSGEKANILNRQFCSVFNKEDSSSPLPDLGVSKFPTLGQIEVTANGVIKLLKKLNPHKASGPDNVPSRLLKELADSLGPVLAVLFQASLDKGKLPPIWRSAAVAPVFKKGDRNKASNYRPISLTCICCKLLEHVVHSSIMRHFELCGILSEFQHGFRKARSCESQLIITINDIAGNMDGGLQTDLVLLDFSKAFDKVPHGRLLHKLRHYGINDCILSWIADFLRGRVQWVVLDGRSSDQSPVSSGVPQGTVLGPLLFLAYINDLPDCLSAGSCVRLFADDSVVYRVINNIDDAVKLQQDLDALQAWERRWLMEFHPGKCQVLSITKRRNPIRYAYTIHGHQLDTVPSARYLGVELTDSLSWNKHIESTSMKGMRALGFLRRNLGACSTTIKAHCYKTFVRPIVEYASCVWSPYTQKGIKKIESVQRSAARYVSGDYSQRSSVSTMLRDLGWDSLEQRRDIARVTMLYRIRNGLIDIPSDHLVPARRTVRGNTQRLLVPGTRTDLMRGSFFPATIRLWNALPQEVVDSPSLDIFKSRVG